MKRDRIWDCASEAQMFRALIGDHYGDHPEREVEKIRQDKKSTMEVFRTLLEFDASDRVVDLGSGTGFVSRYVAPLVNQVHCLDISAQFHEFCAKELKPFSNVTCHLIGYADFSPVREAGINKVFSSGVFIHFNIYDLVNYLKAVHELLPPHGMFAFDFADGEILDLTATREFVSSSEEYRKDRNAFLGLMNWNGLGVVKNLAAKIGFRVSKVWYSYGSNCYIVLSKT